MVLLSRIYTKTGDKGTTALGDGRRVAKDTLRIEAFGAVDELNAALGLAITGAGDGATSEILKRVQNDLFDVGADLCVPQRPGRGRAGGKRTVLRITPAHVQPLEETIDRLNAGLRPLRSFVLPGGTQGSAWLHLARTICRRAERCAVRLSRRETVNPQVIVYLNRLSDLLFVMARVANDGGRSDVLWAPGGTAITKP